MTIIIKCTEHNWDLIQLLNVHYAEAGKTFLIKRETSLLIDFDIKLSKQRKTQFHPVKLGLFYGMEIYQIDISEFVLLP